MAFNPFRKSRPEDRILALDSLDTSPAPTPPPPVSFKTQASPPPPPRSESPLPPAISTTESKEKRRKSNVGKKVRVLSPPQSPDDGEMTMGAVWPFNAPTGLQQQQQQVQQAQQGQFEGGEYAFPTVEDFERDEGGRLDKHESQEGQSPLQQQPAAPEPQYTPSGPPPNPFNKTLHDLENAKQKEEELHHQEELEGAALKAGNLAKGSLDVDAFRRLLMTGKPQDGTASPLPSRSQIVEDLAGEALDGLSSASSTSESSSAASSPFVRPMENGVLGRSGLAVEVTREDLNDDGQRRNENEDDDGDESESSVSVQIGTRGKKPPPPPPSSRHGRSIINKSDTSRTSSEKDVNKPLPVAPAATEGETESPFDREAAGKVPEEDTTTSSEDHSTPAPAPAPAPATVTPVPTPKKPVPAPPPRRGHARTDTKTVPPGALSPGKDEDSPPRSSMESYTSTSKVDHASSSLKPVPAPPPPRRLQGPGSRSGSSIPPQPASAGTPSPALSPSTEPESLHEPEQQQLAKPPPPPPARHGSTRRPQSIHSDSKRATPVPETSGKAQKSGAPAPPPPRQRGSSKGSVDGFAARGVAAQHMAAQQEQSEEEKGKGGDILADLEALQREVDAMRGKLG